MQEQNFNANLYSLDDDHVHLKTMMRPRGQQPSLVRRVTKIAWLDEGYTRATNSKQNLLKITKAFKQISEILVSD